MSFNKRMKRHDHTKLFAFLFHSCLLNSKISIFCILMPKKSRQPEYLSGTKRTQIFSRTSKKTPCIICPHYIFLKTQQRSKKREGPTFGVGESGGWREVVDDDQEVEENGEEDREDKEEEKGESSKLSKYSYYNYEYLTMLEK